MGLDTVELLIAIESAFGVEISNAEAELLDTPRAVVAHLERVLPPGEPWSRATIERTLWKVIEAELGVDVTRHTLDSSFVIDMGAD
ncbi:MAG TPA: hypothetical protein VF625_01665 [Longimicrobium sp.]|jgi:hypothetical protein